MAVVGGRGSWIVIPSLKLVKSQNPVCIIYIRFFLGGGGVLFHVSSPKLNNLHPSLTRFAVPKDSYLLHYMVPLAELAGAIPNTSLDHESHGYLPVMRPKSSVWCLMWVDEGWCKYMDEEDTNRFVHIFIQVLVF